MMQIALIGIAAGAAAALLFASVASGSILSAFLFYLAPLPLMIAALGWSHWAALVGAFAAAASLAVVFGGMFFLGFLVGVGLPAWWLGYLTLLARADPSGKLEWYPAGRVVVWAALLGAFVVLIAIPMLGHDTESFRAALRDAFEKLLRIDKTAATAVNTSNLIDVLVLALPPTAAALTTITSLINLWLAGRAVRMSGRLRRPWPELSTMTFPPFAPMLLVAAVVGSFLPGLLAIGSSVVVASLLMAYGVLGFAVLHAITRGLPPRGFLIGGAYAAVIVFGWPVLAMSALGLIDTILDLRGRVARKRGPPPAAPST